MENAENVLLELNRFEQLRPLSQPRIPNVLEDYLAHVAKSGETLFPWSKIKTLIRVKMATVMDSFRQSHPLDSGSVTSSLDNFTFDAFREKVLQHIDAFVGIPFTIQRLAELMIAPDKHYRRLDKFMRALEKNLLVVSTVEPVNRANQDTTDDKTIVNGGHLSNSRVEGENEKDESDENPKIDQKMDENISEVEKMEHDSESKGQNDQIKDQEMEDVSLKKSDIQRPENTSKVNDSSDDSHSTSNVHPEGKKEDGNEDEAMSAESDPDHSEVQTKRLASDDTVSENEQDLPPKRLKEEHDSSSSERNDSEGSKDYCNTVSKEEVDVQSSEPMSKATEDQEGAKDTGPSAPQANGECLEKRDDLEAKEKGNIIETSNGEESSSGEGVEDAYLLQKSSSLSDDQSKQQKEATSMSASSETTLDHSPPIEEQEKPVEINTEPKTKTNAGTEGDTKPTSPESTAADTESPTKSEIVMDKEASQ